MNRRFSWRQSHFLIQSPSEIFQLERRKITRCSHATKFIAASRPATHRDQPASGKIRGSTPGTV